MNNSHFDICLDDWLRSDNICLIIIDMQNVLNDYSPIDSENKDLLGSYSVSDFSANLSFVVSNLKLAIRLFRKNQWPVIYTRIGHQYPDFCDMPRVHRARFNNLFDLNGDQYFMTPGYQQYEVIDDLRPHESDVVIDKTTSDSFHGTNLDIILRNNRISRLVIGGSVTTCCVSSTARSAFDLGYLPNVLADGSIATSQEAHEAELKILRTYYANVLTTRELVSSVNNPQ